MNHVVFENHEFCYKIKLLQIFIPKWVIGRIFAQLHNNGVISLARHQAHDTGIIHHEIGWTRLTDLVRKLGFNKVKKMNFQKMDQWR